MPAWYCVRSRQKQEHLAAANLRRMGIEVFNPRLRLRRATQRGPVWFMEALFPSYLFARFELLARVAEVRVAKGVASVVQFGERASSVEDGVIVELRRLTGDSGIITQDQTVAPGKQIIVATGPLQGLFGVALQILPAADRVRVLLEILGRATEVELDARAVALADVRGWKETVAGKLA